MEKYVLDTNGKVNKDTTISLLSDFHVRESADEKRYTRTLKKVENVKPDYIFILGDIVEDVNCSSKTIESINKYLTSISEVAPVYFVYGNHDTKTKQNGKWVEMINDEYLDMLKGVKNFSILDDESIVLPENIGLTGINLPSTFYDDDMENEKSYLKCVDESIKNHLVDGLTASSYNVLLHHTPNNIMKRRVYLEVLKRIRESIGQDINYDLILSGHLHNGLIPKYADFVPGNFGLVGLVGSNVNFFQDDCRGIKMVDDKTVGIILPAISSLPQFPLVDNLFPENSKTLILR